MYEYKSLYFFFSSRRRHTRLQGDWSSDVCSSDLPARPPRRRSKCTARRAASWSPAAPGAGMRCQDRKSVVVGKECRFMWLLYYLKKKRNRNKKNRYNHIK